MLADRYDAFLFDLDGVVVVGDRPVTGAVETLERLRDRGAQVRFVTNNSRSTRESVSDHLESLGVEAAVEETFTAASATAAHLADAGASSVYVLGSDGFTEEMRRHGVRPTEADADAVAVGLARTATYDDLATATRLVRNGASFVAANADGAYPTEEGIAPGTGALVAALRAATGRDATVVGKPEPELFERALSGVEGRVAMVGDSRGSDVAGARRVGIDAVLVTEHAREDDAGPEPDATVATPHGLFEE
ncbi:HAD-IIA family hydrolase [Halorarum halophilum]|uniref:HAD-IIA family hydrolase n=1 Tax=Halorarum halophilum TaxID=2743090 RepID=A0A7D5K7A1_9EURY|nr:HAD-IIA family hydrolase [Halobaculum halophilum]QLG27294.1 HAD-IIA family hydrolase [Halobaculum halophilum]